MYGCMRLTTDTQCLPCEQRCDRPSPLTDSGAIEFISYLVTLAHSGASLQDLGFQIIVNPLTGLYAATRALINIHKTLRETGTTREKLSELATFSEFNDLVSLEEWFAAEEKFSPSAFQAKQAKATKEAADVPA